MKGRPAGFPYCPLFGSFRPLKYYDWRCQAVNQIKTNQSIITNIFKFKWLNWRLRFCQGINFNLLRNTYVENDRVAFQIKQLKMSSLSIEEKTSTAGVPHQASWQNWFPRFQIRDGFVFDQSYYCLRDLICPVNKTNGWNRKVFVYILKIC